MVENGSDHIQVPKKEYKPLPKVFSKLYLRFEDLNSIKVSKVNSIIASSKGTTSVIFYDSSKKAYSPPIATIDLTKDIYHSLIDILGEENVVPK